MPSLRDMQLDFLGQTLDQRNAAASWLATRQLKAADGLDIYRNNALVGFQKALQASFPVLVKLAGEDWFNGIAALYQARYPSRSGDLNDVGGEFAEFLAEHLTAESERYGAVYDYFPDVARLEWAFQAVLNLAEVEVPDLEDLRRGLANAEEEFAFLLNPSTRLLESAFPIYELWAWNRGEIATVPDLSRGGSAVLVLKAGTQTRVHSLSRDAATLFEALKSGGPFTEILAGLKLDLSPALAELIKVHAIVGVTHSIGVSYVN